MMMNHVCLTRPHRFALAWSSAALVTAALCGARSSSLSDLKRGDTAPPIAAAAIDGREITAETLKERVLLITFAEAGQQKTEQALSEVADTLAAPWLEDQPITWLVVLSKGSNPALLNGDLMKSPNTFVIHDTSRGIFGAYGVIVLPSAVVVDRDGKVAHATSGLTSQFSDTIHDALEFALGRINPAEFEERLHPSAEAEPDAAALRAARVVHLAERLVAHGMVEKAEREYQRAIEIDPRQIQARLALARLIAGRGAPDDAESLYRDVLTLDPDCSAAALGIAEIGAMRGGAALEEASSLTTAILAREPENPRAHFVSGMIAEKRGDCPAACESFKKAAILLFEAQQRTTDDGQKDEDALPAEKE